VGRIARQTTLAPPQRLASRNHASWRAINSQSEAVSTRDAHPRALVPNPFFAASLDPPSPRREQQPQTKKYIVSVVPAYRVPLNAADRTVAYMSTTAIPSNSATFTPRSELNASYLDSGVMPTNGQLAWIRNGGLPQSRHKTEPGGSVGP